MIRFFSIHKSFYRRATCFITAMDQYTILDHVYTKVETTGTCIVFAD